MLFCVGILIFGTQFCVRNSDSDGVSFSSIYDLFEATDIFVLVTRSLACELSIRDLGCDFTIRVLTDEETEKLTRLDILPPWFLLAAMNHKNGVLGSPISLSFLGRTTNVWRVKEYTIW